jgi:DNA helicase IV
MPVQQINSKQQKAIHLPSTAKIFLEGPAGSGKTTVGIERMLNLMANGVPGNSILVIVPQRILGVPYQAWHNEWWIYIGPW